MYEKLLAMWVKVQWNLRLKIYSHQAKAKANPKAIYLKMGMSTFLANLLSISLKIR